MKKQVLKARMYKLKSEKTPICTMINSTHTTSNPLIYFDEEKGVNRTMRYARNQKSIFEAEQDGTALVEPIIFEDGFLSTQKTDVTLQQFLALHPGNGTVFVEVDNEKDAEKDLEYLNLEVQALTLAAELDLEKMLMIGRVLIGERVNKLKSAELRRDILLYAREDPDGFLEMLDNEELALEELVLKSISQNIISHDKKTNSVKWNLPKNKKRIITVPFGDSHVKSLIAFFKTDEGMEVLEALEKKVK